MPTSVTESGNAAACLPVLTFSMIGFDGKVRQQIVDAVKTTPQSKAIWHESAFSSADCWLVCGEKTRTVPAPTGTHDTTLRVLAGLPSERARTLTLSEIDRPLAFSLPIHANDIAPRLTFDPSSPQSVRSLLLQFQDCMVPTLARFVLGRQLNKRETELVAAVYHATHKGKLLAVLDFSAWRMGLLPSLNLEHLEQAMWEKRPKEAHAIPEHFLPTDLAQLRWTYAKHANYDLLPARYQNELIYFRQSPSVPLSWLSDTHLLLLQELSAQPANVQTLAKRTGLSPDKLNRDLACLYFAASLTTLPAKAAPAHATQSRALGNSNNTFGSSSPEDEGKRSNSSNTVRAQLK